VFSEQNEYPQRAPVFSTLNGYLLSAEGTVHFYTVFEMVTTLRQSRWILSKTLIAMKMHSVFRGEEASTESLHVIDSPWTISEC